jgi:hypothetical protein
MNKALVFMVALALTSPGPAQTVERLPQKFIGTWCREESSTESLSTYQRRKQCEWASSLLTTSTSPAKSNARF